MPQSEINDDAYDDGPFSPDERRQTRRMLEERRRFRWARKQVMITSIWISAVIAAIVTLSDGAKRVLKSILGL